MSVNSALGAMALIVDQIPKMSSPKLEGMKPGSEESFYLLAAYCFNLSRKLEYFFLAAREFGLDADQTVIQRLQRDRTELSKVSGWQAIAEKEEELMRRLFNEISGDYDAMWNRVSGGTKR